MDILLQAPYPFSLLPVRILISDCKTMKKLRTWITTVMLLSLLAGCSIAPQRSIEVTLMPPAPADETPALMATVSAEKQLSDTLLEQYQEWRGTRYRSGGMSKKGVDCSGYVHLTFKERLGLDVPRSSTELVQTGDPIDKAELQTGDLVFFRTGRSRHVGIYLDNGQFMHASSRKGVTISSMQKGYWASRWWTARRIEPDYVYLLAYQSK